MIPRISFIAARVPGLVIEKQLLEPDREAVGQSRHPAHRQQHAGHEGAAVDRVVAQRQGLALAAEDHFLVGDEARQPHRVDRLVDVAAGRVDQLLGALGGARGRVELAVVVQLDDLALGHVRRDRLRHLHQQHGADREVGGDEAVGARCLGSCPGGVEVEAGGADDGVDAGLEAGPHVAERGIGDGEVDDDVGVAQHRGQLDSERRVGPAGQDGVLGPLDRLADRLAHAPGGARDGDPDHAATRLSLTGASALRKRSSSAPTQAAESRSAP
jgi:hypothetical protein